jgi:hypothetical protein
MLAKGPIGVLLPGAVVLLFLASRRELRFLGRMSLGWGLLIGLAVAAPWYLAVALRNPDFARYFLVELNFGSFLSEESATGAILLPARPADGVLPWSVFLPAAWYPGMEERNETRIAPLVLCCSGRSHLVFFSAAEVQAPTYILPIFPPLACWWAGSGTSSRRHRRLRSGPLVLRTVPATARGGMQVRHLPSPAEARRPARAHPRQAASPLITSRRTRRHWFWFSPGESAGFAVSPSFAAFAALTFIVPVDVRSPPRIALVGRLLPGRPMANYSDLGRSAFYTDRLVRESNRSVTASVGDPGLLRDLGAPLPRDGSPGADRLRDRGRPLDRQSPSGGAMMRWARRPTERSLRTPRAHC